MIYLVSNQKFLFPEEANIQIISAEESLKMMSSWGMIQYDSETNGRDAHINDLLCVQFGNDSADARIVVDCTTVDIKLYKEILETKPLIGHNIKFDLEFLYNYEIVPLKVYDTMIVEQLLHLGYPSGQISYSLQQVAYRYLNIDIDKTVRGEIIWRGLDYDVIKYAAGDVTYLEQIMNKQLAECSKKDCTKAAKVECDAVPAVAYLEWCGIKLDETKWKAKMIEDEKHLKERKTALDNYVVSLAKNFDASSSTIEETFIIETKDYEGKIERKELPKGATIVKDLGWQYGDWSYYHPVIIKVPFNFVEVDYQGDLFLGFDLTPKCLINWDSPKQVVTFAKYFGFNTSITDKKTGEDKDSVLEKQLSNQKGINDEWLKLYFDYREASKVCSTYGQGHLDCINPNTGRIHTVFRQLGTSSGRFACGSKQPNEDLAKFKGISKSRCSYPK